MVSPRMGGLAGGVGRRVAQSPGDSAACGSGGLSGKADIFQDDFSLGQAYAHGSADAVAPELDRAMVFIRDIGDDSGIRDLDGLEERARGER